MNLKPTPTAQNTEVITRKTTMRSVKKERQHRCFDRDGLRSVGSRALLLIGALWLGCGFVASIGAAEAISGISKLANQRAFINFATTANYEKWLPTNTRPQRIVEYNVPHQTPPPPAQEPSPAKASDLPQPPPASPSAALSPAPSTSFVALLDNNTSIPPDTHGAVGPNHVMTALNTQVRIQNRNGGVLSTVSLNNFWSLLGNPDAFDPKVLYDSAADRWIFTACAEARSTNSSVLMGVSQSSDPTGNWFLYRVDADTNDVFWADYPSLGFNKDWIVVSLNMFPNFGGGFGGVDIYVFNKTNLYANGAGAYTFIQEDLAFNMVPAITFDNALSTMYLVEDTTVDGTSGELRISTITGPVGQEILNLGTGQVVTANTWDFFQPIFSGSAPQLGSSQKISLNDSRIQNCVYRNGSLWCTHTAFLPASNPTRSAIQWWQLAPSGSILQFGRIDDPSALTWYGFPSIAVNRDDDVLIGYSRFSATQYASGNYSFRAAGDPPNTLQSDLVLKAGEAPYFKTFGGPRNRWGDYSSTVVDPVNDIDMWTIQEYASVPVAGSDRWGTWWGKVDVANISPYRIEFSSGAYQVNEATPGFASITVLNVGGAPGTVNVTATNGTAVAGRDFTAVNGTLTFAAGQTSTNFNVLIQDNAVASSNLTVNLFLWNAQGGAVFGSPTNAVLTIIDDETQNFVSTAGEFNFSTSLFRVI